MDFINGCINVISRMCRVYLIYLIIINNRNNDFLLQIIQNLKNKIIRTQNTKNYSHTSTKKEMDHIYVS